MSEEKQGIGGRGFEDYELKPAELTPAEEEEEDKWLKELVPKFPAMTKDALGQARTESEEKNV